MSIINKYSVLTLVILINILFSQYAKAHAMVAQHGTLNFVDDGVYMVLSLPVSAFEGTDDDEDGKLSNVEFTRHQTSIAERIRSKVVLSDQQGALYLKGLILSPVSSHAEAISTNDSITFNTIRTTIGTKISFS